MKKGWNGEKQRHSNAKKGIKTIEPIKSKIKSDWTHDNECDCHVCRIRRDMHGTNKIEVYVGNIGQVYIGNDINEANKIYDHYVELAKKKSGYASGEGVFMMKNDNLEKETEGQHDW